MFKAVTVRDEKIENAQEIAYLSAYRNTFATDSNTADVEAYLQNNLQIAQIATELADNKDTFFSPVQRTR